MTFAALGVTWILAGLLALAGVLFLLQRLRVRYREHTVVTTLFWKQALEEARARVLVRRFRHLPAYLLVLAIAALMWLGVADPQGTDDGGLDHLVLLDGSANAARGDRFARAVAAVDQRVRELPLHRRRVVLCAETPRTVLNPGEPGLLLQARLAGFTPAACKSTIDDLLGALQVARPTRVIVAGAAAGEAAVRSTTLAALPPHLQVTHLAVPPEPADNQGITALGAGAAASGNYEAVDVLCEVTGPEASADPQVEVSIAGRPVALDLKRSRDGGRTRFTFADLPASGDLLTVTLSGGDALAADDTATLRLPRRKRIRVDLAPSLRDAVGPALAADPAVLLTGEAPDVVVRRTGEPGAAVPTLQFVPVADQRHAILVQHLADRDSEEVLLESLTDLGLTEVDAMQVARTAGRRIELGAVPGERRGVLVWAALLAEPFNLVQSKSFPVFIARSVRWLAAVPEDPDLAAAGEPLGLGWAAGSTDGWTDRSGSIAGGYTDAKGTRYDPVGARFVPPAAGVYRSEGGAVVAAALTSPSTTGPSFTPPANPESSADESGADLPFWLVAVILVLLLVEWFLFRTGRMP